MLKRVTPIEANRFVFVAALILLIFCSLFFFEINRNATLRKARNIAQIKELDRIGAQYDLESSNSLLDLRDSNIDHEWFEKHFALEEYRSLKSVLLPLRMKTPDFDEYLRRDQKLSQTVNYAK